MNINLRQTIVHTFKNTMRKQFSFHCSRSMRNMIWSNCCLLKSKPDQYHRNVASSLSDFPLHLIYRIFCTIHFLTRACYRQSPARWNSLRLCGTSLLTPKMRGGFGISRPNLNQPIWSTAHVVSATQHAANGSRLYLPSSPNAAAVVSGSHRCTR